MATVEVNNKVAKLNDEFRRKGVMNVTQGVFNLHDVHGLIQAVQDFGKFTEDNDPYSEHDFGSLEWKGKKIFWKIDYYDEYLKYWCDPLDPDCNRVLTIMLAEEY